MLYVVRPPAVALLRRRVVSCPLVLSCQPAAGYGIAAWRHASPPPLYLLLRA
jgi:hypothetical protein